VHIGWPAGLALGVVATAAIGVGGVVGVRAGEALPGTTVSGVDVGGLGRDDIVSTLAGSVDARTSGTVVLVDGERRFPVDRSEIGVRVDLQATAERAIDAGRSGSPVDAVLGPLLGRGEDVALAVDAGEAAVERVIDTIAAQIDVPPSPGAITVAGTAVTAQPPQAGRVVDRERAVEELERALEVAPVDTLTLPIVEAAPQTTPEQVEQVAAAARQALAAPYRLVAGGSVLELGPAEIGPLLSAEPVDGGLRLAVDRAGLERAVAAAAQRIDQPPTNATFVPVAPPPVVDDQGDLTWTAQPATVTVQPGTVGRTTDVAAATAALADMIGTATHEGPLPVAEARPELTTEEAQQAGVTSLLGTFTTRYVAGQPRARNIQRIAEIVNGSYVAPGESFSLNGKVGPRTRAKGFVADSAIIDGELVDQVGGGVSQFATTLFNAAFFAGLPIDEHQPHSFYISRYPAGRESTVNYDTIDVEFRNDTAHGMVIRTSTTPSSVTVAIYGDNGGRTVTSRTGARQPRDGGGFTIAVTRTVTGGDGKGGTRVFRTTYNPPPDS
jgi:vancomycin resistance protein YoaR